MKRGTVWVDGIIVGHVKAKKRRMFIGRARYWVAYDRHGQMLGSAWTHGNAVNIVARTTRNAKAYR